MTYDPQELQDDDSDGEDVSEDEGESGLKSLHGKRKSSSSKSSPNQRPEKKSKSTYKTPLHKVRVDTVR